MRKIKIGFSLAVESSPLESNFALGLFGGQKFCVCFVVLIAEMDVFATEIQIRVLGIVVVPKLSNFALEL